MKQTNKQLHNAQDCLMLHFYTFPTPVCKDPTEAFAKQVFVDASENRLRRRGVTADTLSHATLRIDIWFLIIPRL